MKTCSTVARGIILMGPKISILSWPSYYYRILVSKQISANIESIKLHPYRKLLAIPGLSLPFADSRDTSAYIDDGLCVATLISNSNASRSNQLNCIIFPYKARDKNRL